MAALNPLMKSNIFLCQYQTRSTPNELEMFGLKKIGSLEVDLIEHRSQNVYLDVYGRTHTHRENVLMSQCVEAKKLHKVFSKLITLFIQSHWLIHHSLFKFSNFQNFF